MTSFFSFFCDMDSLFQSDRIILELSDAEIIYSPAFLKEQGTTQYF